MCTFKTVSDKIFALGESPRWDDKHNMLWVTDLLAGKLYRINPEDGCAREMASGKNVGGFALGLDGDLICACHQGIYGWKESTGFRLIADVHEGHPLHCNDGIADARGRFLFGTSFYDAGIEETCRRGKLFCMQTDASIDVLDEGFLHSNGLVFSPDSRVLYYTDSAQRVIYAYDYDIVKGRARNRRVFAEVPVWEGLPDGLAVDAAGYIWSANWYGARVVRYTPDGAIDFVARTSMQQTSAVAFGGINLSDLFITTANTWVKLKSAPANYTYEALEPGGALLQYNFGIKGKPTDYAKIKWDK